MISLLDLYENSPLGEKELPQKKAKKVKKETLDSKLAEIDKQSQIVALEAKINHIDEIVEKKPRLILYWSKLDLYNFDDEKRMPYIQNYLLNNYVTYDKTEDWHFLLKK